MKSSSGFRLRTLLVIVPFVACCVAARAAIWQPMESGTTAVLLDVWGSGPSNVFAVGLSGTVLLRWHELDPGYHPASWKDAQGMWGDKKNLFIGAEQYGYPNQTGMMYNLGADGWQTRVVPSGSDAPSTDVWGSTSKDVYASKYHGAIIHYDGNPDFAWTYEDTGISGTDLFGIWASNRNDIFAVGRDGTIVHGTPSPALPCSASSA